MRGKCIVGLCSLIMMLFSCAYDGNNNISVPKGNKMISPTLTSVGSYVYWTAVEDAVSYDVYENGSLLTTIEDCYYDFGSLDEKKTCYVVAKNEKRTATSQEITIYSNTRFEDSDICYLDSNSAQSQNIDSSVRKIVIGNTANSTNMKLNLQLKTRQSDLYIDLYHCQITGSIFTESGKYQRSKTGDNYSVFFNVIGDCSIRGVDGKSGFDYSGSEYYNKEKDADPGTDGQDAIILPTVAFTGGGNLTLSGGNGGNGGKGTGTSSYSSAVPGRGANGGDGGAALLTSITYLNMSSQNSTVFCNEGSGGKKGSPGSNGSVLTGPACSLVWSTTYDIGVKGSRGKSQLGKVISINGGLKNV